MDAPAGSTPPCQARRGPCSRGSGAATSSGSISRTCPGVSHRATPGWLFALSSPSGSDRSNGTTSLSPHVPERVRPRPPVASVLLPLRRQRSTLPLPCRSLAHSGRRRRCLLCLASINFCLSRIRRGGLICDQSGTSWVPDDRHHRPANIVVTTGKSNCRCSDPPLHSQASLSVE